MAIGGGIACTRTSIRDAAASQLLHGSVARNRERPNQHRRRSGVKVLFHASGDRWRGRLTAPLCGTAGAPPRSRIDQPPPELPREIVDEGAFVRGRGGVIDQTPVPLVE